MVVVDSHAFKRLVPVLGVWLFMFLTAGDGWLLLRRQYVLAMGTHCSGILTALTHEPVPMLGGKRRVAYFRFPGADGKLRTAKEPVGKNKVPAEPRVRVLGGQAFLEDDAGYSRFKLLVFGSAFAALWLWALGRYRFG